MFLESSPGFQLSSSTRRLNQFLAVFILTIATAFSTGCAGIASGAPSPSTSQAIHISVMPGSASVVAGDKVQFAATLTSTSNTAVAWHASAGTISGTGLFTAPSVSSSTRVTVTVVSAADSNLIATSDVTVSPLLKLAMQVQPLPRGTARTPYSTNLTVTGGVAPYHWQIAGGSLPPGFSLDRASGVISGITSETGNFAFTASVADANSAKVSGGLGLTIGASTSGNFDGPAELPRVYVQSALADTPAPGSVIAVPKGGDFQQALNRAKCGDTITLQAGASFTGSFIVPSQTCDDAHWIIVRTSAPDGSLPPEGRRITPCYAGVPSLPGRPALNCAATTNVLAKVQSTGNAGPLVLANGASHYRFIGLELTRTPGSGVVYNVVVRVKDGAADHIIFDRNWIHGTAQDETQRGVMLSGLTQVAVVDSYLSDFHCTSRSGACTDAQAIADGSDDQTTGPFKIIDNFLESSGECILLGGSAATKTPTDIEIRRNHMFKPMIWMKGQPGYVGGTDGNPFIVKNHLELKNAQRVLIEANVLENTWGGFSQAGGAVVLGPKNQASGTGNVCPICQVTDVTIRYVTISHVATAFVLGNGVSDNGGIALAGGRYSIHDVTADDINAQKYIGYGTFAQVSMGKRAPVMQPVTISHVTAFQPAIMLNLGDDIRVNPPMINLVFTNNLINAGMSPTHATGGGIANCAYYGAPIVSLPTCFQRYTFSHNAIIASPFNYPPSKYPIGNYFPATPSAVGFVNYANGIGGDYRLQPSSPYKNAGSDGKDLGADMDALNAAIAGVR
ncbi:MAG TPA: Ig domain-containing protein [Candidatus Sulfotelmatobacter sp.]|nr:Ig domain-containing protein [Candidatus Sulfotelmatobacter sp.]